MRIDVTQDDINRGVHCAGTMCPVALAVNRATGRHCRVSAALITFHEGGCFSPVREVREFIYAFDDRLPVAPFSFDIPDEILVPA